MDEGETSLCSNAIFCSLFISAESAKICWLRHSSLKVAKNQRLTWNKTQGSCCRLMFVSFFFLFCALLLKGYSNVILYIRYWLVLRLFNLYSFGMMMAQLWKNYGWTRSCKKVPCLNYFRVMLRASPKLSPVFYALNLIGLLNEWHGSYAYMIIFLGQLNSWWG